MDFGELKDSLNEKISHFNEQLNDFFSFIGEKLKNFKNLSLGEQISYCCIGAGLLLILISIVLFVLL